MRAVLPAEASAVVLVEGESDRLAVEALADRLGVDLAAARAAVVPMGGVTNLRRHLATLAAARPVPRVVGLFDVAEIAHVQWAVADAGLVRAGGAMDLTSAGFFACDPDLEGELIRALGTEHVEQVLAEHGELGRFRTFQRQPAQRSRATEAQLRRFMGTHSGRKARFAPVLVRAIDDTRIPTVLTALVASAVAEAGRDVKSLI